MNDCQVVTLEQAACTLHIDSGEMRNGRCHTRTERQFLAGDLDSRGDRPLALSPVL